MTDGGGYDPKRRSAPAQSAPAQSYTAPVQSYSAAPAAAPMAGAPASKWEPCTLLFLVLFRTCRHSHAYTCSLSCMCTLFLLCIYIDR